MKTLFFILGAFLTSACSLNLLSTKLTNQPKTAPILKTDPDPSPIQQIAVSPAPIEDCPNGGKLISTFLDLNGNLTLDLNEVLSNSFSICNGASGQDGQPGPSGNNGHNMQFTVTAASNQMCPTGGSILAMALDITDRGSYSITDPNQQTMVICNGLAGAPASVSGYSPAEVIQPCGQSSSYEEVLLRLANGEVLAAFSENVSGLNTRLALIPDGTYMTSDGTNCIFSLSTNEGTRSVSWLNQIQQSWTITP